MLSLLFYKNRTRSTQKYKIFKREKIKVKNEKVYY